MRAGDVLWNPLTGEKAMLVQSAEETGGARIVTDFAVEAGGFVPGGEHVHDHCAEHFEVRAGRINFVLDGEERALGAGEQVTVAPGTWHRWWNAGEGEVQIRVRVEPAMRFEEAILVFWGLCADGHTNAEGRPSPLLGALVGTRYRPGSSATGSRRTPSRGFSSRRSRRLPGCADWRRPSIAISIPKHTRPRKRASVASPNGVMRRTD